MLKSSTVSPSNVFSSSDISLSSVPNDFDNSARVALLNFDSLGCLSGVEYSESKFLFERCLEACGFVSILFWREIHNETMAQIISCVRAEFKIVIIVQHFAQLELFQTHIVRYIVIV